jgi:hypothetical protein
MLCLLYFFTGFFPLRWCLQTSGQVGVTLFPSFYLVMTKQTHFDFLSLSEAIPNCHLSFPHVKNKSYKYRKKDTYRKWGLDTYYIFMLLKLCKWGSWYWSNCTNGVYYVYWYSYTETCRARYEWRILNITKKLG